MKQYLFFISALSLLPACLQAQNDVYFIPSKEVHEVTVADNSADTYSNTNYYQSDRRIGCNRDVDEYNRRKGGQSSYQDSSYTDNDEALDNSEDYRCGKLIMRFHAPITGITISSPYYWDICYGNNWDVYYDGGWAYSFPSWNYWSYAYDPWSYNRWWYRSCWDYTWGWCDPWYSMNYWGWSNPCYWGWDRPYYGYWGGSSWRHDYAPGFGHAVGGGRYFASDNDRIVRGSAGGFIRQGGSNYRSMYENGGGASRSFASNRGGLTKSFRNSDLGGSNTVSNAYVRTGGGGYSRSGSYNPTRSNSYSRSSSSNYTPSRGYSRSNTNTNTYSRSSQPTQSYTPSSSSSSGSFSHSSGGSYSGGGSMSSGGGGGRSGGGGFSRGGGGGGGRR